MAERRMFAKKVTDDDQFALLSSSAQALYLHLSMAADDDGFCNQVTISMFRAHASVEDLKSLLERRYIYQFENGVIVIRHWRMANALRKDRYTQTVFKKELAMLHISEDGTYEMNDIPGDEIYIEQADDDDDGDSGCQLVAERLPQVRLGKDSKGKDNKNTCPKPPSAESEFERLWEMYPKKQGKKQALAAYLRARRDGTTFEQVERGIESYVRHIARSKTENKFIKMGSTYFNQNSWNDEWEDDTHTSTKSREEMEILESVFGAGRTGG